MQVCNAELRSTCLHVCLFACNLAHAAPFSLLKYVPNMSEFAADSCEFCLDIGATDGSRHIFMYAYLCV